MSFREILGALWRRKWIIVAVTLLAMVVAVLFLGRLTPTYSSTAVIRISPVMSQAITSGSLAGIAVDADPAVMLTPQVLDTAAQSLGEETTALQQAVTQAPVATTTTATVSTISVSVTATGSTSDQAQSRVTAVVTSYHDYLAQLITTTLGSLNERLQAANEQAAAYQAQVGTGTTINQIAQSNLTSTLSTINTLNQSISTLQTAGEPLTVSQAAAPGASTTPGTLTVLAIALVSGLLAGGGIALIRDHFDDRLREDDDVEDAVGAPVLGVLANDRQVARKKEPLPTASPRRTTLSEGIRSLRTSVQVLLPQGKGVIVVTSVEPGDGKTFLSSNLALSWARAGRKVILVGGDLRRPELQTYFDGLETASGLGELLDDALGAKRPPSQQQVLDALVQTRYRGLRILPAGHVEGEPADLLAGPATARIVRLLEKNADIVVIDSPPALALADASELATNAYGVLLVARVNQSFRANLAETAESLSANGARVLGVVLNRSQRRLPATYDKYYGEKERTRRDARTASVRPVSQELEDEAALRDGDQGLDDVSLEQAPDTAAPESAPDTAPTDTVSTDTAPTETATEAAQRRDRRRAALDAPADDRDTEADETGAVEHDAEVADAQEENGERVDAEDEAPRSAS